MAKEHVYNDAQMLVATQVAYLDIPDSQYGDGDIGRYVDDILNNRVEGDADFLAKQREVAETLMEISHNNPEVGESWRNWKVVETCNDTDNTGYYGCLIDTGDGNAIVGNRGSESYDATLHNIVNNVSDTQLYKDWGTADFGLLDNKCTSQQAKAADFVNRVAYKYGDQYDSFSFTGHSLGGNLAEHQVINAPAIIRNKIDHCISFDGPGYSQEYISANKDKIEKVAGKIDHYQWSWVSSLLFPLPGVKDTIIKAHDNPGDKPLPGALKRHDTRNVELKDGYYQDGDESWLSTKLDPFSKYIEHVGLHDLAIDFVLFLYNPSNAIILGRDMLAYGVKMLVEAFVNFKEIEAEVKSKINDAYHQYIASIFTAGAGEYEVDINGMQHISGSLDVAKSKLDRVNGEIERISSTWKFDSLSGSYYRNKLRFVKWSIERDINILKKLSNVIDKEATRYDNADRSVAAIFY